MAARPGIDLTDLQRQTLREARRLLGLTQSELAAKLQVTQEAVAKYESGDTRPSAEVLERWAAALGYEVERLGVELRPLSEAPDE